MTLSLLARFGGEIEAWARAELSKRRVNTKSINLPGGNVSFRDEQPRLVVMNHHHLVA